MKVTFQSIFRKAFYAPMDFHLNCYASVSLLFLQCNFSVSVQRENKEPEFSQVACGTETTNTG